MSKVPDEASLGDGEASHGSCFNEASVLIRVRPRSSQGCLYQHYHVVTVPMRVKIVNDRQGEVHRDREIKAGHNRVPTHNGLDCRPIDCMAMHKNGRGVVRVLGGGSC
jgi:hypothetical protein